MVQRHVGVGSVRPESQIFVDGEVSLDDRKHKCLVYLFQADRENKMNWRFQTHLDDNVARR